MSIGTHFFWLAPFFPLAVFVLLAANLSRFARLAIMLAITALAGSVVISGLGLFAAAQGARAVISMPWLQVGGRRLELALWLDPLGISVATLVSMIGLMVFVYAASYMADDPRRGRFFAELSLFIGAMLTLVLAADLVTLFISWELVGLCSYLLIGFWFEKPEVPSAATKAFLTTRVGDLAMLAGILLLVSAVGSSRIDAVLAAISTGGLTPGLLRTVALLLFTGAAGKSAQVPFQGWLPDAMVGPTPVSALLHSATMVAAGVFFVARLYPLFLAAEPVLALAAWVGAITALLGATAALVQPDLKRLLAYSTMSQLGLMFMGLGAGSLLAGVLLLLAQALYKSTLFLAAGAVDHAVEGTAFARMGGLAPRMPCTCLAFAVSAAALAGLPVTLALPPKDPVLAAAWAVNLPLFATALLVSLLTALYSAHAFGVVFLGRPSAPARQVHEARAGLLAPTLVLSGLVVVGLLMNAQLFGRLLGQLLGVTTPEVGMVTTLALAVAGVGVGLGLWARRAWPHVPLWPVLQPVAPAVESEFGLIPAYRALRRAGLRLIATAGMIDRRVFDPVGVCLAVAARRVVDAAARVDHAVFDSITRAAVQGMRRLIQATSTFDLRRLDAAVRGFGSRLLGLSQHVRRVQTGRIENYLLAIFVWGVIIIAGAALAALL